MEYHFTVEEATDMLISKLSADTGWKYLKSQRMLKQTINKLVFEIHFFSSKWNESHKSVEVNAEFRLVNKEYGGLPSNVNNIIAWVAYQPDLYDSEAGYWYDISTEEKFESAYTDLRQRIRNSAVSLYQAFEKDPVEATRQMFEEHFDEYNIHLDYVADMLGIDSIRPKAHDIYQKLSEEMKQQVTDYRNGARNKTWMHNRCNLKYIIDNNVI